MKREPEVSLSSNSPVVSPRLACFGLALLTLVVYLPVGHHRFLYFDDPLYITENKEVQAGLTWKGVLWALTDLRAGIWHPVTWLSHMMDCQLFGLDASAHHLMNALWHAINAGLVLLLFYRLTRTLWPSAFAAGLFALHPLRVESVAWAAERKDVLSTFFFLLTVITYLKYVEAGSKGGLSGDGRSQRPTRTREHGARGKPAGVRSTTVARQPGSVSGERTGSRNVYYALAVCFFALGLMSKAMLVTTPFVLVLLDVWPLRRVHWNGWAQAPSGLGKVLLEKAPFFVLTVAVSLITMMAQRSESMASLTAFPLWLRSAYSVLSYGSYLLKMVWPVDLAIVYPLQRPVPWLGVGLSGVVLIGLTWACWQLRQSRPHLLLGWAWFVGTLVPVIGLVQVGAQSMADRYTYLPHIGLFLALAFEARHWVGYERIMGALAAVILVAFVALTEWQLGYWVDGRTLFTHTIAVTGENAFAHLNLAVSLEHTGKQNAARHEYEEALRLDPGLPEAHANLGDLLNEQGENEAALAHYKESLRLQEEPQVHENLGALLVKLGQFEPAMAHFDKAAKLAPDEPRPHYLAGKALLRQGKSLSAVAEFREALSRDKNDLQTLVFLARVLAADPDPHVRNGAQAVAFAERANNLSGGMQSFVLDTLAMTYAESGRFEDAVKTQQLATDRANDAGEKEALPALQERLQLYRDGRPYRENFAAGQK